MMPSNEDFGDEQPLNDPREGGDARRERSECSDPPRSSSRSRLQSESYIPSRISNDSSNKTTSRKRRSEGRESRSRSKNGGMVDKAGDFQSLDEKEAILDQQALWECIHEEDTQSRKQRDRRKKVSAVRDEDGEDEVQKSERKRKSSSKGQSSSRKSSPNEGSSHRPKKSDENATQEKNQSRNEKVSPKQANLSDGQEKAQEGLDSEDARVEGGPVLADTLEPPTLRRNRRIRQCFPGAVAVSGSGGSTSLEASDGTVTAEDPVSSASEETAISVLNARVVDEENNIPIGPLVEAKQMEQDSTEPPLKILLRSRNVKIVIAVVVVLFVTMIAGVVTFFDTRHSTSPLPSTASSSATSPSAAPVDPRDTAAEQFRSSLTPLLSSESVQAFEDHDSPQALALRWFLGRSNFSEIPFRRQVQRYAMSVFFYSTSGHLWLKNADWLSDTDECTWYQSQDTELCDENGDLLVLSLVANDLHGPLPDELSLLSSLVAIDLGVSELEGTIPAAIGNISRLETLHLNQNKLVGPIPSQIGQLSSLRNLDLSENSLSSTIPPAIGNLTSLEFLDLSLCDLTGTIPRTVAGLSSLQDFRLQNSTLSGSIHTEFGLLNSLKYLDMDFNDFSGTIPSELGQCTDLQQVYLANNALEGTVPSQLGELFQLQLLHLHGNFVSGAIPSQMCSLPELLSVDFRVSCDIPSPLVSCSCCSDSLGIPCFSTGTENPAYQGSEVDDGDDYFEGN